MSDPSQKPMFNLIPPRQHPPNLPMPLNMHMMPQMMTHMNMIHPGQIPQNLPHAIPGNPVANMFEFNHILWLPQQPGRPASPRNNRMLQTAKPQTKSSTFVNQSQSFHPISEKVSSKHQPLPLREVKSNGQSMMSSRKPKENIGSSQNMNHLLNHFNPRIPVSMENSPVPLQNAHSVHGQPLTQSHVPMMSPHSPFPPFAPTNHANFSMGADSLINQNMMLQYQHFAALAELQESKEHLMIQASQANRLQNSGLREQNARTNAPLIQKATSELKRGPPCSLTSFPNPKLSLRSNQQNPTTPPHMLAALQTNSSSMICCPPKTDVTQVLEQFPNPNPAVFMQASMNFQSFYFPTMACNGVDMKPPINPMALPTPEVPALASPSMPPPLNSLNLLLNQTPIFSQSEVPTEMEPDLLPEMETDALPDCPPHVYENVVQQLYMTNTHQENAGTSQDQSLLGNFIPKQFKLENGPFPNMEYRVKEEPMDCDEPMHARKTLALPIDIPSSIYSNNSQAQHCPAIVSALTSSCYAEGNNLSECGSELISILQRGTNTLNTPENTIEKEIPSLSSVQLPLLEEIDAGPSLDPGALEAFLKQHPELVADIQQTFESTKSLANKASPIQNLETIPEMNPIPNSESQEMPSSLKSILERKPANVFPVCNDTAPLQNAPLEEAMYLSSVENVIPAVENNENRVTQAPKLTTVENRGVTRDRSRNSSETENVPFSGSIKQENEIKREVDNSVKSEPQRQRKESQSKVGKETASKSDASAKHTSRLVECTKHAKTWIKILNEKDINNLVDVLRKDDGMKVALHNMKLYDPAETESGNRKRLRFLYEVYRNFSRENM